MRVDVAKGGRDDTCSASRIGRPLVRRFAAWVTAAILLAPAAVAGEGASIRNSPAAPAQDQAHLLFEIPAQPLQTALEAYAKRFDVQVFYKAELVQGLRSAPVSGVYSEDDALLHLLDGTGLKATFVSPQDISITAINTDRAETRQASLEPSSATLSLAPLRIEASPYDVMLYDSYAHLVQARIRNVLGAEPTESLAGRGIWIMVWVDPKGFIRQAVVIASSGDGRADARILEVVNGLSVLEQPPVGLPQPLHVRIYVAL